MTDERPDSISIVMTLVVFQTHDLTILILDSVEKLKVKLIWF